MAERFDTTDPDWFETYFDERVIRLYRARLDPAETREEVAALVGLLGLPAGARILDVPCGWGRHALPLAEARYEVTGVDISPAVLAAAERAGREAGLQARWVQRDMRELDFDPVFDAALCLHSSLGYFVSDDEDLRVLHGIRRALRPGGRLLLETMHRDAFVADFRERERWDDHDGPPIEVRRRFDAVAGINHERLRWPDGTIKQHRMRVRSVTRWRGLVQEAGFRVERLLGGWDETPIARDSPVLIVMARRRE